jgi:hypothetical protein
MKTNGLRLIQRRTIGIAVMVLLLSLAHSTPAPGQSAAAIRLDTAEKVKPAIRITKIPAYGSFEDLQGIVTGVDPAQYQVAVYVKVRGRWWTKPTWAHPTTPIYPGGTWFCDVTTGGIDQFASAYAAFLIPKGFKPPLRHGEGGLPDNFKKAPVAKVVVHRQVK